MTRFRTVTVVLSLAASLAVSRPAAAQLAQYSFVGLPGDQTSTPASMTATNVTATGITRSAALNPAARPDSMSSTNFTAAFDLSRYYTFTVTASNATRFDFNSLNLTTNTATNGPRTFEIRTSLDGFTTRVGAYSLAAPAPTTTRTIDLNGLDAQTLSAASPTSVEFRFYASDAGSITAQLRLMESTAGPGVSLNGSLVPSPVPEPTTTLALAAAGLAALRFSRRRVFG